MNRDSGPERHRRAGGPSSRSCSRPGTGRRGTIVTYLAGVGALREFLVEQGMPTAVDAVAREHVEAAYAGVDGQGLRGGIGEEPSRRNPAVLRMVRGGRRGPRGTEPDASREAAQSSREPARHPPAPRRSARCSMRATARRSRIGETLRSCWFLFFDTGLRLSANARASGWTTSTWPSAERLPSSARVAARGRSRSVRTRLGRSLDRWKDATSAPRRVPAVVLDRSAWGDDGVGHPPDAGEAGDRGGYRSGVAPPTPAFVRSLLARGWRRGDRPHAARRVEFPSDAPAVRGHDCGRAGQGGASASLTRRPVDVGPKARTFGTSKRCEREQPTGQGPVRKQ